MGIASLVLGILAVLSSFVTWGFGGMGLGLIAMILGILGRKAAAQEGQPTGMATAGMALGISGLALGVVFFVTCALCVAAVKQNVEEAKKAVAQAEVQAAKEADQQNKEAAKAAAEAEAAPAFGARCDSIVGQSTCTDYPRAAIGPTADLFKQTCETEGAEGGAKRSRWTVGAECPHARLAGSCTLRGGMVKRFYHDGGKPFSPESARRRCTTLDAGTWSAAE
jgi:hypothetical protein